MEQTPVGSGSLGRPTMKQAMSGAEFTLKHTITAGNNYLSYTKSGGNFGSVRVSDVHHQNMSEHHSSMTGGFSRKSRHQAMYDQIINKAIRNNKGSAHRNGHQSTLDNRYGMDEVVLPARVPSGSISLKSNASA